MQTQIVKQLNDKHILAMHLQVSGYRLTEIAPVVGLSYHHLVMVTNSAIYKAELEMLRTRMRNMLLTSTVDKIVNNADKSVDELIAIRDDPNTPKHMKVRISQDILDRIPQTSKVHRNQAEINTGLSLTEEQEQLILETYKQDNLAQEALRLAREALQNNISDELLKDDTSDINTMINVTPTKQEIDTQVEQQQTIQDNNQSGGNDESKLHKPPDIPITPDLEA